MNINITTNKVSEKNEFVDKDHATLTDVDTAQRPPLVSLLRLEIFLY